MGVTGTLLYMSLLGFGAVITPGVGMTGSLLALFPQVVTEYSHAPAYGVLAWLLTRALRQRGWPKRSALSVSVAAAMVFGVWMEVLQGYVPGRVVDLGDVAINGIGIGAASLLIGWAPERSECASTNAPRSSIR